MWVWPPLQCPQHSTAQCTTCARAPQQQYMCCARHSTRVQVWWGGAIPRVVVADSRRPKVLNGSQRVRLPFAIPTAHAWSAHRVGDAWCVNETGTPSTVNVLLSRSGWGWSSQDWDGKQLCQHCDTCCAAAPRGMVGYARRCGMHISPNPRAHGCTLPDAAECHRCVYVLAGWLARLPWYVLAAAAAAASRPLKPGKTDPALFGIAAPCCALPAHMLHVFGCARWHRGAGPSGSGGARQLAVAVSDAYMRPHAREMCSVFPASQQAGV